MNHRLAALAPLAFATVAALGCASVPEVEERLQAIGFHSNLYVVQAGDTLETIAYRYELSPETLASLNPGLGPVLLPGTRINVRPGTELPSWVREGRPRPSRRSGPDGVGGAEALRHDAARAAEHEGVPPPVIVDAVSVPRVARPEPLPPAFPRERAATAARADGWTREEIVSARDAEAALAARRREALDAELQRYVGEWTWPTDGAIARGFAPARVDGQGVDIAGVPGQEVRAARDGEVIYSGRDLSGEGLLVIVRHEDGLMTTYSHAAELYVEESDRVRAGEPIASLGWNARDESVLRFEVRRDGVPLDPLVFLPSR